MSIFLGEKIMPHHINQFNRVYRNGCAYPLPSRMNIMATYIQYAISLSISALKYNEVHLKK